MRYWKRQDNIGHHCKRDFYLIWFHLAEVCFSLYHYIIQTSDMIWISLGHTTLQLFTISSTCSCHIHVLLTLFARKQTCMFIFTLIAIQALSSCCQDNAASHWSPRYHVMSRPDVTARGCRAKRSECSSSGKSLLEFELRATGKLLLLRGSCNLLPQSLKLFTVNPRWHEVMDY